MCKKKVIGLVLMAYEKIVFMSFLSNAVQPCCYLSKKGGVEWVG